MAKKKAKTNLTKAPKTAATVPSEGLVDDLRRLIEQSRQQVAQAVNSATVWLYWNVGKRIREDILGSERARYGEEIVSSLSAQLTAEYGRGFSRQNLFRMIQFAEVFPDEEIVSSLMRQLSWTHLIYIIPLGDPLKRDFYAEMCRLEGWSVRTLQKKIGGMMFERTALSKKPDQVPPDPPARRPGGLHPVSLRPPKVGHSLAWGGAQRSPMFPAQRTGRSSPAASMSRTVTETATPPRPASECPRWPDSPSSLPSAGRPLRPRQRPAPRRRHAGPLFC